MRKDIGAKKSKIEHMILALTKAERRQFGFYLECPLFNEREDLRVLFQWLQQHSAAYKEKVFAAVYPEQPFSAQRLRLLFSYLQQKLEHFIALQQWQKTTAAPETEWVRWVRKQGINTYFPDAIRTAQTALERQPLRNSDYFWRSNVLLWEEARFQSVQNPGEVQYINHLSDNADVLWVTQKLRYFCLHSAQRIMYQSDNTMLFKQEVEAMALMPHLRGIPAVAIWYNCLKMLELPTNTDYFRYFETLLLTKDSHFDADEIRDLHLLAVNYCIRQANAGAKSFLNNIMAIYKDSLSKGYLLENGVLSRFTYHNIVTAGLQTREFEWVEQFIQQYRNALERRYRDSSYSFNLARLEFSRKRYDVVLPLLQHSNYYDPLLGLAAKAMSMKIYYETAEFDLLYSHLEAMKNYIRRKPTLGYHREHYLNLIRFTQKLATINQHDAKAVAQLRAAIAAEPALMEREWLLEQV